MHGLNGIHAKLKKNWAKLTRHRNIRFNTKTTLKMKLRSQKDEVGGGSIPQDGSVPPNSEALKNMLHNFESETVDDVPDSDEEMEDYEEESGEDEGSLYAPTDVTSEPDREWLDEDKDLMEVPPVDLSMFLVLLPRELRDKIYGYVLKLDNPISDHQHKFKCVSCPGSTGTEKKYSWQSEIYESRNLLRTCHQIRDEGKSVFYEVNSWGLHRARLRETPPGHLAATFLDTQKLFDRIRQFKATKLFRHVNIQICMSPLAYCDFPVPETVALDDPVAIHAFELSQQPSVIAFHKLDEMAQCELFMEALNGLVRNRASVFPELKSLTLQVSLHGKKLVPNGPHNPLDRCGITFYVRIKLGCKRSARSTYLYNASRPSLAPDDVIHDPYLSQRLNYEACNHSLDSSILKNPWSAPLLDHRRSMLSPLQQLLDVQCVDVERRWTVRFRRPRIEDGNMVIRVQPLRQLWHFETVDEMLESAGFGFVGFLDPALEYLQISRQEVVDIIENTTEDSEHHHIS